MIIGAYDSRNTDCLFLPVTVGAPSPVDCVRPEHNRPHCTSLQAPHKYGDAVPPLGGAFRPGDGFLGSSVAWFASGGASRAWPPGGGNMSGGNKHCVRGRGTVIGQEKGPALGGGRTAGGDGH